MKLMMHVPGEIGFRAKVGSSWQMLDLGLRVVGLLGLGLLGLGFLGLWFRVVGFFFLRQVPLRMSSMHDYPDHSPSAVCKAVPCWALLGCTTVGVLNSAFDSARSYCVVGRGILLIV